ncbi:CPBP family intramembrane glutamic endopeptidase [Limnofasciculus baicalensis]|uniref:CPBP family glutamic-type intramembrane protease n=1 Tax=Limnofasciculus baicalensis BBK-W-15 TaxID=2699891 RepID=A0AAE3GTR5_9CYAN|nr:CPBP family glutamic-type intramembrane protease [Limnofasciculus baicalensis]MCP2730565.1 CPBP family glutamic-type intramembrane protease [Limnofasciculus baicalensis BBK-W-15]
MGINRLLKLVILVLLTFVVIFQLSFSLVASWGEPQIQSRLELYQTNLLLHAAQWQGGKTQAQEALLGGEPFKNAQNQYEDALAANETTQSKIFAKLQELSSQKIATATSPDIGKSQLELAPIDKTETAKAQQRKLQESLSQTKQLMTELKLRLGIIQAAQGETDAALKTWGELKKENVVGGNSESLTSSIETATVLIGLWSKPPQLLPDAEAEIHQNLDSWFRYRGLTELYKIQQRQDVLLSLETQEQNIAQQSIVKLAVIGLIPGIGGLVGVGLLVFIVAQRLLQGRRSLLSTNADITWETPWNGEIIWQVLILGFFFFGQLLLPLLIGELLQIFSLDPSNFTARMKALYTLSTYIMLAFWGLLILYFSIKQFFPLSEDWFRFKFRSNWFFWGLGGYLVALPLVIGVSLINQQLWKGQGGSNPILPLVLEGQDNIALLIFFMTACFAAPLFEEMMFRGFLLPSLTRYLPVWGAIILSSLVFAIAHLSLSEVLPLTTLGIVLGVVYSRSRNLLAPMLLHSLWNSGTLLSLFILGSGSN